MFAEVLLEGAARTVVNFPGRGEWLAIDLLAEALGTVRQALDSSPALLVPMSTSPETVGVVLAAAALGATVVSVPAPRSTPDVDEINELANVARDTGSCAMVADYPSAERWRACIPSALSLAAVSCGGRLTETTGVEPGFKLIQHTSGSTGPPRPVVLTDADLGANVSAILDRLAVERGDSSASWLPLAHDMGLVGILFSTLAAAKAIGGASSTLISPEQFLRSPTAWLRLLSEQRTTITALPDFGLRAIARRYRSSAGADLSALRAVIVGAEMIRCQSLHTFVAATS